MKTFRLFLLLVFSLAMARDLGFASTEYISKEIPLRFTFDTAGESVMHKESPSIPQGLTSIKAYLGAGGYVGSGGVPIEISIPGKLTIQCPKNDIYPGNQVICRAWITSEDDPANDELSSDYGAEFGIKIVTEDFFFGNEYEIADFGYDFLFKIRANGKMPLGNNFLCDMDTINYFSLPIDEFIPGSTEAGKIVKTLLNINSYSGGYDIMSLGIAAEMVIEGKKVILSIDGNEVEFTGFRDPINYSDPLTDPNVKQFTIYIPTDVQGDPKYDWQSRTMIYDPIIQYEFNGYYTIGASFTLIPGISFNIFPEIVAKGQNPLEYSCPSPSTLHNGNFYGKFAEDFKVSNNIPISIALPLTDSPNLPDVAITNVYINDKAGEEKAYVGEKTYISFDITNLGVKETSEDPYYYLHLDCFGGQPHFNFSVYVDGEAIKDPLGTPIQFRRVDQASNWYVCNAQPIILGVNESVNVSGIEYQFETEGFHTIEIKIGHSEYKGALDSKPIYALGDSNRANNKVTLYLNVLPPRGTVHGHLQLNPCNPDCGVDGIKVCLRNVSYQSYNECTISKYDNIHGHGFFSFSNVPTGDYWLEILPEKPSDIELQQGAPFWAPRRFSFHHEGNDSDELTFSLVQYQTLTGKVIDNADSSPISGVEVALGEFGTLTSTTGADGKFSLKYLMPGREYNLTLKHPYYQRQEIQFLLLPWSSWDTAKDLGSIPMFSDTTAPSINMKALANSGFFNNTLKFSFGSYDNDKPTYQYRYIIMDSSGQTIYTSPWQTYSGTTPDSYIDITHSLQTLTDGVYKLKVEVRDHKNNTSVSPETIFTKDTTAPQFTITLSDPVTGYTQNTDKKLINVGLSISNSEPGPLSLYLSNDGQNWTYVTSFVAGNPGYTIGVNNWEFVLEDVFIGSKTVYAKLVDMASNQGYASDAIDVDTTGAVKLAGGSPYWYTTNVLLEIGLTPPPGNLLFGEWGMGGETNIGDTDNTQYLAQKLVLNETKTLNVIHFFLAENTAVVGTPAPLHIQLVHDLLNSDPKSIQNPGNVIKEWVFEEGDVRCLTAKYTSYIPLYFEPAIVLNPGTYYLVVYSETVSADSYYKKPTGYYSMYQPTPQNHMRFGYNASQNTWVEVNTLTEIWTLSYQAYYSPEGQVKIALDGNCDNSQWSFQDFKKAFMVNLPHDGLNTVCVEYYNPLNNSKNKKYYSSIFIDTTKPSGQVSYSFNQNTKTYTFNFSASSDTQYIKFSLPNGYQKLLPMSSSISIGPTTEYSYLFSQLGYFDLVNFSFIDNAWNESQTYTVQIGQQDDIFAPIIQLGISGGSQYTNSVNVPIHIYAEDSFCLSEIKLKELVTGNEWTFSANGKVYSEIQVIDLPELNLNGINIVLDGTYKFVAQAKDCNGNTGYTIIPLKITLDREPPKIQNIKLTSIEGKSYTISPDVLLTVTLQGDMSQLSFRHRFEPNGQWSDFAPIQKGRTTAKLVGYTPLPEKYEVTVQVMDAAGNYSQETAQIKVNRKPVINSIVLSSLKDPTPIISVNCQDPDWDDIPVASFTIKKPDSSVLYSTGTIEGLDFEVPPGFLSYNEQYGIIAQVVDSYGLASNYFESSFTITKPKLTVEKLGYGSNKVTSADGAIDCGTICEKEYDFFAAVTLNASASEGAGFTGWSGDCSNCGTSLSCSVTVDKDTLCQANFAKLGTIVINSGEGGSISCSPNPVPYGGNSSCGITPKEGHHVVDVKVDGVSKGTISTYTFDNVTTIHVIEATFEINKYSIVTSGSPSNSGTVSCTPNPVTYSSTSDCNITPYTGYHIVDVKVDNQSKGAISQFSFSNVTSDHTIDASFALNKYKITTVANPASGGSISCSPDEVDHNSNSTCTITAKSNYTLKDVQGTCGGSLQGNTFTTNNITGDCTVYANFEIISHTLNVGKKGEGSGVIISSPAGINCGSDCSETYQKGTSVTLTAQPDANSEFAGWGGSCTGMNKDFQLTMDQDNSCIATFNLKYYTFTVSRSGTGSGTITTQPSGIQCGDKCSDDFVGGSVVQLNATPSLGSIGGGWFGDCATCGNNAICEISMDSNKSCTYVFIAGYKPGWNLVGLIASAEISVLNLLGNNKDKFTSLWKWTVDEQGKQVWAVYLTNADKGGEAYANAKGFLLIQSIKPGEGFWVNVGSIQEGEVLALIGNGTGNTSYLEIEKAGWNLVSLKGVKDKPIAEFVSAKEEKIISIWKWIRDEANPSGKWGVYLPDKEDGGLSYAKAKGFALIESIKVGEGFWVNVQNLFKGEVLQME